MVRDEELKRLIRYAQGMGISVRFKPYVSGSLDEAEWHTDGSMIVIYVKNQDTKLSKILSLIHELGHHKAFIAAGRKLTKKVDAALDSNTKRNRKIVLEMETADSLYWEQIYRDTNCTFGIEKLRATRHFDLWQYRVFYRTGSFPSYLEKRAKRREMRKRR